MWIRVDNEIFHKRMCPACRETRDADIYCNSGELYGIAKTETKSFLKGVFKKYFYECEYYKCYTCGCEWKIESRRVK